MDKAYTVNTKNRIITINDSVKATAIDEKDITMYVSAGYIIRHKSEERSKAASKRADNLKDEEIREALKDNKEALTKYDSIKNKKGKGGGFFAAKSWYKKEYLNKKEG